MREIGGYFGLEKLISNEYYKDLIPLNSGRNALLYILKVKNIKKIYIPHYLCDSVSTMLKMFGYDFEYYNINSEFMPIFNKILDNDEYLYVVNYYGQLYNHEIIDLSDMYKQIILDNTHAFFQRPLDRVDTIYSCRKFFGVSDGSYLSTYMKIKDNLETDISKNRMTYILGRYEGSASEYYSDFENNNESFKTEPLKLMSKLTRNILGAVDYEVVCQIRNANYAFLNSCLGIYNKLKPKTPNGAFAYPLYIENGIEIRKRLAKKGIYIPTLWPNVLNETQEDSVEYAYTANILPLPCDQRYEVEDMDYIVKEIKKCIN